MKDEMDTSVEEAKVIFLDHMNYRYEQRKALKTLVSLMTYAREMFSEYQEDYCKAQFDEINTSLQDEAKRIDNKQWALFETHKRLSGKYFPENSDDNNQ